MLRVKICGLTRAQDVRAAADAGADYAGVLLCPSDMGRVRFPGMHGYHPSEPTADAVLLATVPVERPAAHIADVHGVLLDDLGLGTAAARTAQAAAAPA